MRKNILLAVSVVMLTLPLAACNEPQAAATADRTFGPSPTLPAPEHSWIPTVDIATPKPWPMGAKPTAANGMAVEAFATGLDHPRSLYVLPNGDVLVAETNAPPKPDDSKGIKGFIYKQAQKWAGAGVPSPNRITLLRATKGDGNAETRSVFLEGLNSPFGMVLVGEDFYVANTDAIMKFPYHDGDTKITAPGVETLRNRRLQQQCRRKRHRSRDQPRRGSRGRPRQRKVARVCIGPSQSKRAVVATAERCAVGCGQ